MQGHPRRLEWVQYAQQRLISHPRPGTGSLTCHKPEKELHGKDFFHSFLLEIFAKILPETCWRTQLMGLGTQCMDTLLVTIPWHKDRHEEISSISMSISLPIYRKIQKTCVQSAMKFISRASRNCMPFNLNAVSYAKNVFYCICIVQIFLVSIFPLWMTFSPLN